MQLGKSLQNPLSPLPTTTYSGIRGVGVQSGKVNRDLADLFSRLIDLVIGWGVSVRAAAISPVAMWGYRSNRVLVGMMRPMGWLRQSEHGLSWSIRRLVMVMGS